MAARAVVVVRASIVLAMAPPVTEPTVAELVVAVQRGERAAFDRLYDRFSGVVHAAVLARVPYRDAHDLVQDVFLIAFRRITTLREAAAFPGWILMIARNRATDYHRREPEPGELDADGPAMAAPPPPRAEALEVLEVIRRLPEAYRETLLMRLVEDLTGPEIAERTGMTPESVRVNLCRGMKLLRERLGVETGP
jgi:RNA polymerase sigma-70 factor (ECF subfamily)